MTIKIIAIMSFLKKKMKRRKKLTTISIIQIYKNNNNNRKCNKILHTCNKNKIIRICKKNKRIIILNNNQILILDYNLWRVSVTMIMIYMLKMMNNIENIIKF